MISFQRRLDLLCLLALGTLSGGNDPGTSSGQDPPTLEDLLQTPLLQEQPADSIRFAFAWSELALRVDEISWKELPDKPAMCVELGYELALREAVGGWVLHRQDNVIERVNGFDIALLPDNIRAGMLGAFVLPDLKVIPDGTYGGLVDFEGYVTTLPSALSKFGTDPKVAAGVVAMARTPEGRAVMEQNAGDPWRTWVETWAGLEGVPGEEWTSTDALEVLPGLVLDVDSRLRFHGFVEEPAGHVLLSAEITMGEGAGKLLGWMKLVVEAIDEPLPAKADEELKGAAFTSATHVVLVTDPRTLIPHRATTERLIRVSNAGGVQGTRREAKQWRFTDLSMKEASEGGR